MKVILETNFLNSFSKVGNDGNKINYSRFLVDNSTVVLVKDNKAFCTEFKSMDKHTILCEQFLFNGRLFYNLLDVK